MNHNMVKAKKFKSVHNFGNIFFVIAAKARYGKIGENFILMEDAKKNAMTDLLPHKTEAEDKLGITLQEVDNVPQFSLGYSDSKSDYLICYMAFFNSNWFSLLNNYTEHAPLCCLSWCNSAFTVDIAKIKNTKDAINFGRALPNNYSSYEELSHRFTPGRIALHATLFVRNNWARDCEDLFKA